MAGTLTGIMIIPTGLGCTLGGDAAFNPGVKLLAACCDRLIVNPNAVNASDINELPNNCWYVEGSTIDRFLAGEISLRKPKTFNRILMVANPPIGPSNVNAMNAGIWGLGADVRILELRTPLTMFARLSRDGTAGGTYSGVDELVSQISGLDYDALAIQTLIDCDHETAVRYWKSGGVNPWGGIEAMVSKIIATRTNKPVAHAPSESESSTLHLEIEVKRSMAPEIISNTYTFCILKGLHRAPRIESASSVGALLWKDVSFLVTPHGCFGPAHQSCVDGGIPVIVVRENETCFSRGFSYPSRKGLIFVSNYLEAAGFVMALSCGVDPATTRVPRAS